MLVHPNLPEQTSTMIQALRSEAGLGGGLGSNMIQHGSSRDGVRLPSAPRFNTRQGPVLDRNCGCQAAICWNQGSKAVKDFCLERRGFPLRAPCPATS